ncbi:hypothetical protein Vadar_016688 [Vaccinium darrowii]|uniref:Uncharacterized protein n=1 Tax=Vaccinium darrowii TaxID=229202 RepID=A0ACB7YF75_9ERIC|nr:hypothetical protein Vadar_016688 [Vaccinium darrowii]
MRCSMASISRRLCHSLFNSTNKPHPPPPPHLSMRFFCTSPETSDSDDSTVEPPDSYSDPHTSPSPSSEQRTFYDRPLENGLDIGVYKAILVGQVGQIPIQKRLRSGRTVTLLSVGTGGIRNNRRPLDNEEPREYANRCAVQWHRVSVYPERLGAIALKHVVPGSILYLEGNLETKIFTDQITGLVRRIREIAIRRNGRLVLIGKGDDDAEQPIQANLRGVGYY